MNIRYALGLAAVIGVAATAVHAAEPFDSKLQASTYKTKLVQAMDECLTGTTLINGLDACAPANLLTDGTSFNAGSISVRSTISSSQVLTILKSSGNSTGTADDDNGPKADLGGKVVHTRLVLRITRRTTSGSDPATFVDVVLNCAPVTITGTGNMVWRGQLAGALGCNLDSSLANEQYEKEIISASVVDDGTGKAIAVPGVRKK